MFQAVTKMSISEAVLMTEAQPSVDPSL